MEIYSHPNKLLKRHIEEVASGLIYQGVEPQTAWFLAQFHDIGKVHSLFQKKLQGERNNYGHALPSAILAANCLYKCETTIDLLPIEIFHIIYGHHAGLHNINDLIGLKEYKDKLEILSEILLKGKDIVSLPANFSLEDLVSLYKQLVEEYRNYPHKQRYFLMKFIFGALIRADRHSALNMTDSILPSLSDETIESAMANLQNLLGSYEETPINQYRKRVAREIKGRYVANRTQYGQFSFSAPTGAGKTAIAIDIALRHMKEFGLKRLIYVVPFVTIAEQAYNLLEKILDEDFITEDTYMRTLPKETELSQQEANYLLWREWYTPVVITTTAYIWDVLFSPYSTDNINMPMLQDAVIIFDEVQAFPAEYWKDWKWAVEHLKRKNYVLSFSATHPIEEIINVSVPDVPMDRYVVSVLKEIAHSKLIKGIMASVDAHGKVAVVANTLEEALELYHGLVSHIENIYLLTGELSPYQKKAVLSKVRRCLQTKEKCLLISTQVIEAGVDISFNVIWRAWAPLDNIIQTAGRCNRSGDGKGIVVVFPSRWMEAVYGGIKVWATDQVLHGAVYTESELKEKIVKYYQFLRQGIYGGRNLVRIADGYWRETERLIKSPYAYLYLPAISEVRMLLEQIKTTNVWLKRKLLIKKLRQFVFAIRNKERVGEYEKALDIQLFPCDEHF